MSRSSTEEGKAEEIEKLNKQLYGYVRSYYGICTRPVPHQKWPSQVVSNKVQDAWRLISSGANVHYERARFVLFLCVGESCVHG